MRLKTCLFVGAVALACAGVAAANPVGATGSTGAAALPVGVGATLHDLTLSHPNTIVGSVSIDTPEPGTLMASASMSVQHIKAPGFSGAVCRLILDKYQISNQGEAAEGGHVPGGNVGSVASLAIAVSWPDVTAGHHTVELECVPLIPIAGYEVDLLEPHVNLWMVG